jgi:ribosomal protein L29
VRRDIARMKTILREREIAALAAGQRQGEVK